MNDTRDAERFHAVVHRWLTPVHRHVTLVYPYANTDEIVRDVFRHVATGIELRLAPTERSMLYRLARVAVQRRSHGSTAFRQRNADAVALATRDAATHLVGPSRLATERTLDALYQLSLDDREVLRLLTVDSLEIDELAWVLDLDYSTADSRVATAHETLRELVLLEHGGPDE